MQFYRDDLRFVSEFWRYSIVFVELGDRNEPQGVYIDGPRNRLLDSSQSPHTSPARFAVSCNRESREFGSALRRCGMNVRPDRATVAQPKAQPAENARPLRF